MSASAPLHRNAYLQFKLMKRAVVFPVGSLFEPLRCQILVIPRRAAVGWPRMFQLHINFHTQDIIGPKSGTDCSFGQPNLL
ncbi:hypothetical protein AVEN_109466-1, partial [Araneus ventricosus]